MVWEEFCYKVSRLISPIIKFIDFKYDSKKISYVIDNEKIIYTKKDYDEFLKRVDSFEFSPFNIYGDKYNEVSLNSPDEYTRKLLIIGFTEKIIDMPLKDEDNGITYSFRECSNELLWYIINSIRNENDIHYRYDGIKIKYKLEDLNDKNIFNIIKIVVRVPLSIVIECDNTTSKEKIQQYLSSFLFNFSYNFDIVLKPIKEYDELFTNKIINRRRRISRINEIEVPQYIYKQELIEQYNMALSSSDPFVKFIGFYHIMEHFYENVYSDEIVKNIQNIIRNPGFSSRRKKDVLKLVDVIKKKTRQNKEEFIGSEIEALELTLKKYVDIIELRSGLEELDETIIEYYKLNEVSFSLGDTVDLNDIDVEKIYKKIASRIYKTRNALVHNKSNEYRLNERGIYKPFVDNKELSKEIPLMRLIAELIIIGSSSNI